TACVGSVVCFALALVSSGHAQEKQAQKKESAFHRMEIYNGSYRTVHYFSDGASAAEQAKQRDAERSENEAALAGLLRALRRQYLTDESLLQARRREVQLLYYGHTNVIGGGINGGGLYPYGYGSGSGSYAPYGISYYAPPSGYYGYSFFG